MNTLVRCVLLARLRRRKRLCRRLHTGYRFSYRKRSVEGRCRRVCGPRLPCSDCLGRSRRQCNLESQMGRPARCASPLAVDFARGMGGDERQAVLRHRVIILFLSTLVFPRLWQRSTPLTRRLQLLIPLISWSNLERHKSEHQTQRPLVVPRSIAFLLPLVHDERCAHRLRQSLLPDLSHY
jgi:hypothetical protein